MRKLNRKGFTLIELLAIIVILAIILVIAIPEILNTMDNSRVSSLHSSAVGVAKWWDEQVTADNLVDANNKVIGTANNDLAAVTTNSGWICISSLTYNSVTMFEAAGLDATNVVETGTPYSGVGNPLTTTCSSIRYNDKNVVEVLLVANPSGRFYVSSSSVTYAISTASNGVAVEL